MKRIPLIVTISSTIDESRQTICPSKVTSFPASYGSESTTLSEMVSRKNTSLRIWSILKWLERLRRPRPSTKDGKKFGFFDLRRILDPQLHMDRGKYSLGLKFLRTHRALFLATWHFWVKSEITKVLSVTESWVKLSLAGRINPLTHPIISLGKQPCNCFIEILMESGLNLILSRYPRSI